MQTTKELVKNVDITTITIKEFKILKNQLKTEYETQLNEIQGKLPHNYAAIIFHQNNDKYLLADIYAVKRGSQRNDEILKELQKLVKTSSQNAKTLITVENE